ncbi:histidine phosphatase family protein [Megamonas hypermegale]|uniref:histidine phosphatase family protein n=1 Tax=Megamonas hypermegale TaxID=158847 RepID=UPI0026E93452|nr:histidine phosphatase family protein [Megamonas hypermegale]
MLKVIFIRHGKTLWNSSGRFQGQSNTKLAAEGIAQAEKLAENFPVEHIDAVYSSPLERAFITGKIIADKFHVPITADERLCEISFGAWEGLTYDEIHAKWPAEIEMLFSRPDETVIPQGEKFSAVQKRAVEALNDIIAQNTLPDKDRTVVITAHGGILRALLSHILHMPLRYIWSLRQDNTAVSIITYYGEKYNIELINSTAHLGLIKQSKQTRF